MEITLQNLVTSTKPIVYYLLFTLFYAFFKLNKQKTNNKLLIAVLVLMMLTEVLCVGFDINGYRRDIKLLYNFSIPLHNIIWLLILYRNINMKLLAKFLSIFYILFSVITNLFHSLVFYNYSYLMVVGAFIYLVLFIAESFYELQKENFAFFSSNIFILLFSPILLFLGLSIGFGFRSTALMSNKVFGIELYDFISHFTNIVYYSFINLYIYREKRNQIGN